MNRSLKLSMLLALALGSTQAAALELGQIQVKSALGQPLLAEIPLTPDSPAELHNITARLASPEDFARAGLTGVRPDVPLQFNIVDVGGRKVIRITSAVAVNDPYLDLLVEVDNASGRSLREFPVLLDPPGTAPAVPGMHAPRAGAARSAARPAPAGSAPARPAAGRVAAGGQYQVERGQTLSGIARRLAPAGVDAGQMMLALKQANPDAFYQDNINALKSGAVLRVPTGQEAQATSVAAAIAEIRRQNSDWRAQAAPTTTVADAATRTEAAGAPAGASADRLALVPAKQGGRGAGAQGAGKGDAALRQDLMRTQETLTTLQQQSADLKSRLKDLQDINDKNTRLLALKDNEIAELQQKLADARKKAGLPAAAAPAPATAPATAAPVAAATKPAAAKSGPAKPGSAGAIAASTSVSPSHSAAAAPAVTRPAAKPASKPSKPVARKPATPAPVEQPWFMQPWAWAAAGGAVLLLILLALLGRRRKSAPARAVSTAPSLADRFGAAPDVSAPTSADPDQDELLDQLAEHPDDIGLHLELVSLYYSRRDVEHFEAAAEAMHAHIADPQQDEWQDVVAMGEDLVPGHPLFAGQGAQDAFDSREEERQRAGEAIESFDLDSYASQTEDIAGHDEEPAMAERPKVSEYHFDFDLTPPRPGHADTPAMDVPLADEDEDEDEDRTVMRDVEPTTVDDAGPATWNFEEPVRESTGSTAATEPQELGQFSDDPIDTKLDLARAYMDMGDADGARAMLEEVMNEGTQIQKDAAQRLLDSLA
ncbi:MAG TPA: FimV/HubP family polar landmark protein [Frateuria sp.]|uniref:FimV/HubP family polar landmark protein n=1 Tax=Frateuria sp. TaxID=2211372 RepID=UPI002D7E80A3|nr:FimV/HubP family polar landmark protein [Frateuria sp.]HET6806792.1 FimV/HubP family polar landmark protein [Frateuria sp.]